MVAVDPLRLAESAANRAELHGLDYVRRTRPQQSLIHELAQIAVWQDGNQMGKSYWLAEEAHLTARGQHPVHKKHRPPLEVVVMGVSYEQMVPLMEKLWQLAPKHELDPRCSFDPGRGITGKPPRIVYTSGPGAGSVISFATYKQGAKNLAGKTVPLVIMDEPPPEKVYGEVVPRVFRKGGRIRIGMTPTPDMPDVTWLRQKCDSGEVAHHNYGLSEENLWLIGAPGPFLTQAEIDAFEAQLLPVEREMRMGRSWDPVPVDRWLGNFEPESCVLRMEPPIGARLALGIDHGAKAGKQTAVLMAFWDVGMLQPRVLFMDETSGHGGRTTPREDAEAILAMLEKHGLTYDDIDEWTGDRPLNQSRHGAVKSNQLIRKQFAGILKRDMQHIKPIPQPKKYAGSELDGLRLLNGRFGTRHQDGLPMAIVHPRCENFAKACLVYQGRKDDPVKDHLDAGRYAFERVDRDYGRGRRLNY